MSELITVPVALGRRSYDVVIGPDALSRAAQRLTPLCPRRRAFVVADAAALDAHGERLKTALSQAGLEPIVYPVTGGERAKSWAELEKLVDHLLDAGIERSECVMAFGGGTVGDLAGFAAAVTKRGLGFIQLPTTLLAQVDSSVGGKTGINTASGKNLAGAFHQPSLVLADTALLDTLPEREVRAGFAEIIKAGLIADAALFRRLEEAGPDALNGEALTRATADAVAFKARVVAEDEREGGVRALLNLGHTFAHAFEAEAEPGALIHGEAVAAGLALAFRYSVRLGVCPSGESDRVVACLNAVGLPASGADLAGGPFQAERLVARMASDKKNRGGAVTLVLARAVGEAYITPCEDTQDLTAFLIEDLKTG